MTRDEILTALKETDKFGLLARREVKKPTASQLPLVNAFEEIVDFFESNGRLPECRKDNIQEFQLYHRYKSICRDSQKLQFLRDYDLNNILVDETNEIDPIERLKSEDVHGLLAAEPLEIFKMKHVSERIAAEYISRRKFCHNFSKYQKQFEQIASDLQTKRRKLINYSPEALNPGRFYVLNGIILYLESVDGESSEYDYRSGTRTRFDGRTSIVFDNGTMSDMLYRSLDKALQKDGFSISEPIELSSIQEISEEDNHNGYIYILRTKNNRLSKYKNLYKIGCTTSAVSDRIKNAHKEATYLFSEVEIVKALRCYNIIPDELEDKIHKFFNEQRLSIEIYDKDNNLFRPREWFVVALDAIEEAVSIILRNEQDIYYYNQTIQQIVKK
ncbi:GIY-YIG nuclease family protein [Muribaculaceae bacterium Isolate-039 (Harlan)]|uniref:Bacteriophage T5 Orf172 DNA-binding domain-containing protein n=3 Tax=Muribaculaceae TaxID=2005473 RepID=A0A2V1IP98_9BACT|nr:MULTISPECIES: GIY-YIG nuclease family protein [Muribaculaceae]ROS84233.1 GIY-YIG nuclease family protein [Muribaculaceae bacterium Isolate-036 (Harlan)]ROS87816.1 GIY-YIG nuclease family protein [Muribaculaceae bacterium Isolate-039 (Harlan)]ROS88547.1 GIY-YIG nuclease family protein [Muribaculaceae bacterium Isolate-043 (Harlan)]MCX4278653.1 GIY-YIG nuclease family protein [Muribaculum sp.]PWB06078.1 hypothetical protein C5O25_11450 [Paramuribaculum intestinale]